MANIVKVDFNNKQLIDEVTFASSSKDYGVFTVVRDEINRHKQEIINKYLAD